MVDDACRMCVGSELGESTTSVVEIGKIHEKYKENDLLEKSSLFSSSGMGVSDNILLVRAI